MTIKRKVKGLQVEFEDGEMVAFLSLDATLSISENARKLHGFKNGQEWTEYHLTWVEYHGEDVPLPDPVEVPNHPDKEALRGMSWCSQHNCEPIDCFEIHNPTAFATEENSDRWSKEVIQVGKEQTMRMYNLTDIGLEKWIEWEDNGST